MRRSYLLVAVAAASAVALAASPRSQGAPQRAATLIVYKSPT